MQAIRNRQPIPEKLANAPVVPEWLEFYYTAFWELGTCRAGGTGMIMWTALDSYAQRYGITDPDDYEFFRDLIRQVDTAYLDLIGKRGAKGKGGEGMGTKSTPKNQPPPKIVGGRKRGRT